MGSWVKTSTPAPAFPSQTASADKKKMDAIRKKMQSLKAETEQLYATIASFEEATREASARADQADCDIRDLGKKVQIQGCCIQRVQHSGPEPGLVQHRHHTRR